MPAKIRLTRHGKKKKPYYHIVIADSRAPRDGKYIERIGNYDPNQNPRHKVRQENLKTYNIILRVSELALFRCF